MKDLLDDNVQVTRSADEGSNKVFFITNKYNRENKNESNDSTIYIQVNTYQSKMSS